MELGENEANKGLEGGLFRHGLLIEVVSVFLFVAASMAVWRRVPFDSWLLAGYVSDGIFCAAICFLGLRHSFGMVFGGKFRRTIVRGTGIGLIFPGIFVLLYFAGSFRLPYDYVAFSSYGFLGKLVFSVSFVAVGPILEELLFRGYFYPLIRIRYGVSLAALLSSLMFALVHRFGVAPFVVHFVQGLIFAWAYQKSGTVMGSIIAHSMNNLVVVVFFHLAWWGRI